MLHPKQFWPVANPPGWVVVEGVEKGNHLGTFVEVRKRSSIFGRNERMQTVDDEQNSFCTAGRKLGWN